MSAHQDDLAWAKPYVEQARTSVERGDVISGQEFFERLENKLNSFRSHDAPGRYRRRRSRYHKHSRPSGWKKLASPLRLHMGASSDTRSSAYLNFPAWVHADLAQRPNCDRSTLRSDLRLQRYNRRVDATPRRAWKAQYNAPAHSTGL